MKENLTHICCITDRSGSMAHIKDDVIGGFNTLIEEQRKQPGDCTVTYCQFDDRYEMVYADTPLDQVPLLTDETFIPRGGTALLDAIGRTIATTGERLAAMDEAARPGKVLCIIITDGQENQSREYQREQVRDMIKLQTEKYSWEFIYLGADEHAFQEAASMGLKLGNVVRFAGTGRGTRSAYGATSQAVSSYRAGGDRDNLVAGTIDLDDPDLHVPPRVNNLVDQHGNKLGNKPPSKSDKA